MVMVLSLTVQFTAVPDDMSVISDIGNLVDERELAMANIASIITNAKAGTLIFFRMSFAYIYKYVQIFKKKLLAASVPCSDIAARVIFLFAVKSI